jgi:PAS domain S-box-containing protein
MGRTDVNKAKAMKTVLIVSDNAQINTLLNETLHDDGHRVISFTEGANAISYCELDGYPDLALVDVSLTDADSYEIVRRFKTSKENDFPILMLIEDIDSQAKTAFQAGATDILLKPIALSLLRQRVQIHLDNAAILQAYQSREERYRAFSSLAADFAYELTVLPDGNRRCGWSTDGLTRISGYTPDELCANLWETLVHPDDRHLIDERIEKLMAGETDVREYRILTKSGEMHYVRDRVQPIADETDERIVKLYGIGRDITDTHEMQIELRESRERLKMAIEAAELGVWDWDMVTNESYFNERWLEMLGYKLDELDQTFETWAALVHPEDSPLVEQALEDHIKRNAPYYIEHRLKTKSGAWKWIAAHGRIIERDASGKPIRMAGIHLDIDEDRQIRQSLEQHAYDLQQRNDELDAFAHSVAHDLKSPIASMMGFASLIESYYDRMTDEQVLDNVSLIMESGYTLKRIIDSLLTLAGVNKIDEADMKPLEMRHVIDDARLRLDSIIRETKAEFIEPDSYPVAAGYAAWVEEIWANYISNAIKYGGTPPVIELGAESLPDGMVRFWVRDNGNGLSTQDQERVFTPFTRLSQVKIEGHGLGLSVVQRIVEKLGGEVGVESAPGRGSVFSFTLPQVVKIPDEYIQKNQAASVG